VAKGIKSALSALSPSPMVALVSGELARATEGELVAVPISLHTSFFRSLVGPQTFFFSFYFPSIFSKNACWKNRKTFILTGKMEKP